MKRPQLTAVAKLLGLKASGTNLEIQDRINVRLHHLNKVLIVEEDNVSIQTDFSEEVLENAKCEKVSTKGIHPITGQLV